MSELAGILERETETVDLQPGGFDRLLHRRDRKERRRRIATAVVATILAIAALGLGSVPGHEPEAPEEGSRLGLEERLELARRGRDVGRA